MRLDELGSEPVKKVVFAFGRLNPPHYGHGGLIQTLQKTNTMFSDSKEITVLIIDHILET